MKRVAVIGAGPAGITALRYMAEKPDIYKPTAFEMSSGIGGTWVYNEATSFDENGLKIHSSMYKSLVTNLPKELMHFDDFHFPDHVPSFCSHTDVLKYLEDFTDHHDLRKYIRHLSHVTKIRPVNPRNDKQVKWEVHTNDMKTRNVSVDVFDMVVVSVGIFSSARIPEIRGMNVFSGSVIHSHEYRTPEVFARMLVLVIGGYLSGQDISVDVAKSAKYVLFSHEKPKIEWGLPGNLHQCGPIKHLTENSVIMPDGREFEINAIILCTGYKRDFPFLSPECHVKIEDERVYPLYKHILHTEYPTLVFIGLCHYDIPFKQFTCQVKFTLAAWEGTFALPSADVMTDDVMRDVALRQRLGLPPHAYHHLGPLMKSYQDDLAALGGFRPYPRYIYELFGGLIELTMLGVFYKHITIKQTDSGAVDMESFRDVYKSLVQASGLTDAEVEERLHLVRKMMK